MDPIQPTSSRSAQPNAIGLTAGTLREDLAGLDAKAQAEQLAHKLESSFLSMMLSAMRETVPESGLFGADNASKMYQQMLDQEYVQHASSQWKLDFHDVLVRQILDPAGLGEGANAASPAEAIKAVSTLETQRAPDPSDVARIFRKEG